MVKLFGRISRCSLLWTLLHWFKLSLIVFSPTLFNVLTKSTIKMLFNYSVIRTFRYYRILLIFEYCLPPNKNPLFKTFLNSWNFLKIIIPVSVLHIETKSQSLISWESKLVINIPGSFLWSWPTPFWDREFGKNWKNVVQQDLGSNLFRIWSYGVLGQEIVKMKTPWKQASSLPCS